MRARMYSIWIIYTTTILHYRIPLPYHFNITTYYYMHNHSIVYVVIQYPTYILVLMKRAGKSTIGKSRLQHFNMFNRISYFRSVNNYNNAIKETKTTLCLIKLNFNNETLHTSWSVYLPLLYDLRGFFVIHRPVFSMNATLFGATF